MTSKGTLYLLPNLLGKECKKESSFPPILDDIVPTLSGIICESEKAGRTFLSHFKLDKLPNQFPLAVVNGKTPFKDLDFYLEPLEEGENWGYVSDCGLPCVADPGTPLVVRARHLHLPVKAINGPSSITMALMLSGLSSQKFMFHGYLPKEPKARKKEIQELEKLSRTYDAVQVFIEAPYRNEHTLKDLVDVLHSTSLFALATDLMLDSEQVLVNRVEAWRQRDLPDISKRPSIFMFLAKEKRFTRS